MARGKGESLSVFVKTDGNIIGRNGFFELTAVEVSSGHGVVGIHGIGKRGFSIRGGLSLDHEAMDELCEQWLRRRGKVVLSDADRQVIGGCAKATKGHRKAVRGLSRLDPDHRSDVEADILDGLFVTAIKLEGVLKGDGRKPVKP